MKAHCHPVPENQWQRKILKIFRVRKDMAPYRGTKRRLTTDVSSKTVQDRRCWNDIFKKGNKYFQRPQKLRECGASSFILEMFKVFRLKENDNRETQIHTGNGKYVGKFKVSSFHLAF